MAPQKNRKKKEIHDCYHLSKKKIRQGESFISGRKITDVLFQQLLTPSRIRGAAEGVTRLKTRRPAKKAMKEYDNLKNTDKTWGEVDGEMGMSSSR
jgi:hypothetical protein